MTRMTARQILEWLAQSESEWFMFACQWCGNLREEGHAWECPWTAARRLLTGKRWVSTRMQASSTREEPV